MDTFAQARGSLLHVRKEPAPATRVAGLLGKRNRHGRVGNEQQTCKMD